MNDTGGYRVPGATYRIQFNPGYRFVDGRDLVPYLHDLGITDMYSSPRYKARRGSSHGYDIANALRVNSELGTEEEFDEMAAKLRHYGMGLLLDTVPNHMAASPENPWWMDVLENGRSSAYASYFDIDWHPRITKAASLQDNKVLLPVLGDLYGRVLRNGEITLKFDDTGLFLRYYETKLPLDPGTYGMVLNRCSPELPEMAEIARDLGGLPARDEPDPERILLRRREKERIKERLWRLYTSSPEAKNCVDAAVMAFNEDIEALDGLISRQAYRVAFWKIGNEEINYRRFFDVNELVGLRVEVPEVFANRHLKSLELVRAGKVTGLRIDHVDGLWDPRGYLEKLQESAGVQPKLYVVVEKILGREEEMPREWPVSGTTGYEFLNVLNGIFVHPEGLREMQTLYSRLTGNYLPFAELCYACNKQVMLQLFAGEVNALGNHLGRLAALDREARDVPLSELIELLVEVTACLPVYRTYINSFDISERDRGYIERTLALARSRTTEDRVGTPAFDFVRRVLLLEPAEYIPEAKPEYLAFVMRWQQFTGPVMAKGLEDSATYRYHALISINEVGSDPVREKGPFDVEEFHRFNTCRAVGWPHSLNATSTHDTKRGEDVRARLNVLSEMPAEWAARMERWTAMNTPCKTVVNGSMTPDVSEEFLIYQTLLGAWSEDRDFPARVKEFLVKALREAKLHSSWISPSAEYETAVQSFVDAILDSPFREEMLDFHRPLAHYGAVNSLAQLVLKVAAPGVPDFYQGSEFWNLSLVDPDNRRPVDYKARAAMLETLRRRDADDRAELVRELAASPEHDETKLYVTWKALEFRRGHPELFAGGQYVPLGATGVRAEHICAFARRSGDTIAAAVVPRWLSMVDAWGDTAVVLPADTWTNVLTGEKVGGGRASELFRSFPVALLRRSGDTVGTP